MSCLADNVLLHQKDEILNRLNDALQQDPNWSCMQSQIIDVASVKAICDDLELLAELWITSSYGYKGLEICNRIDNAARHTLSQNCHHRASRKKEALAQIIGTVGNMIVRFLANPI